MPGLLVGTEWRVTPADLNSFLSSAHDATQLALLRKAVEDPEVWAKAFWEDHENAQRILADEYEEGTFGRSLQDALRRYPPSQGK